MPEFIPEHVPADAEAFLKGYLAAAEWLLDDQTRDEATEGWAPQALSDAERACTRFQATNEALLAKYAELYSPRSGYDVMECAGHDFWLTRTGSGTGFFDRGDDPVFQALDKACKEWSTLDVYTGDNGSLYFA